MNRKILAAVLLLCVAAAVMYAVSAKEKSVRVDTGGKVSVVATLFPQYDFAREIAGAHADVSLLLPPGTEGHTYEPTPSDIVKIDGADIFLYTGKFMEPWAERLLSSEGKGKSAAVDVSSGIELSSIDDDHDHDGHGQEGHSHPFDPHIWTDPLNAAVMADNILAALCSADPTHKEYYEKNAAELKKKLFALDADFKSIVSDGARREIIFGGSNAFHYFAKRYGIKIRAAHDTCSAEADPSAKRVSELISAIRTEHIPVIFYEELTMPKVARLMSKESGAAVRPFHSCHNVSRSGIESGATYISLMKENAESLKEALK